MLHLATSSTKQILDEVRKTVDKKLIKFITMALYIMELIQLYGNFTTFKMNVCVGITTYLVE